MSKEDMSQYRKARCLQCGSKDVQLQKKGYDVSRGLFWGAVGVFFGFYLSFKAGEIYGLIFLGKSLAVPLGIVGLLTGFIGSRGLQGSCTVCGMQFDATKQIREDYEAERLTPLNVDSDESESKAIKESSWLYAGLVERSKPKAGANEQARSVVCPNSACRSVFDLELEPNDNLKEGVKVVCPHCKNNVILYPEDVQ